jgi:glycosyltransferase involved in cell wall biosynthesis
MKIIVFDKFIGYRIGGAQNSLQLLLKNLKGDFRFLGCDVKKAFSAEKYKLPEWEVERVKIKEFPRWPYFEYWYNRKRVKRFIASQKADLLMTQGLWGAIAINAFPGKSIYFIRDEYHFNKVPIYQRGFKKILKKLYILSQWISISRSFKDNAEAIKRASIVMANSSFMAQKIESLFGKKTDFIYALVDVASLEKEIIPSVEEREFIVSIGSEVIKGREIVEKISKIMPDHKFMIVGREFKDSIWKENILYYPWSTDSLDIYKKTKILLVANIIDESIPRMGRTALEAMSLGIPAISSKAGNVSDFLGDDFLVTNREKISLWKEKIIEIEKNYEQYSKKLKEQAMEYDAARQVEKFKEIVNYKLGINL